MCDWKHDIRISISSSQSIRKFRLGINSKIYISIWCGLGKSFEVKGNLDLPQTNLRYILLSSGVYSVKAFQKYSTTASDSEHPFKNQHFSTKETYSVNCVGF